MAVKKTRATTLQEKFGFKDDDLQTQEHDQILFWLDANIDQIAPKFFNLEWNEKDIKEEEIYARKAFDEAKKDLEFNLPRTRQRFSNDFQCFWKSKEEAKAELEELERNMRKTEAWQGLGELPERKITVLDKIWERVIKNDKDFVVGFIDMEVVCDFPYLTYEDKFFPKWSTRRNIFSLMFEAKTSIKSVGELIRQIQLYRSHKNRDCKYIIVSPDDKHSDIFRSQGIGFLKYDGELPLVSKGTGQLALF